MVDIKPVEGTPKPKYPDKYSAEARQALVAARPNRWRNAPRLAGVLSASIVLGLSGCGESFTTLGTPSPSPTIIESKTDEPGGVNGTTLSDSMPSLVWSDLFIPLFEFGEGTGSIGCMVIAPPVFLSEEEAHAILSAAFAEAGLTLDHDAFTILRAAIPVTDISPSFDNEKKTTKTTKGDLNTDLLVLKDSLPVKFVSVNDLNNWQVEKWWNKGAGSSVSVYNIKEAAQRLVAKNPGLLVFYDPVTKIDMEISTSLEQSQAAIAESEKLLRAQAEAFIEWLRAEGRV